MTLDQLLTPAQLAEYERNRPYQALASLVFACCGVYSRAADLLGIQNEEIQRIRHPGMVDTLPLRPAYDLIYSRYLEEIQDPQIMLFRAERRTPSEAWWDWFERELTPQLLRDDHAVRCLLRSMRLLRCENPLEAIDAVESVLSQMPMRKTYFHTTWPPPL